MANKFKETMRSTVATPRSRVIFAVIVIVILGGLITGAYLGYMNYKYYSTDNAYISAPLIPVVAFSSCQIISLDVNYGAYVERGQRLATVGQPRPSNPADSLGSREIPMGRAIIEAPVSGYIAAIWQYPGAVVTTGAPMLTISDVSNIWVIANVSEGQLHRIDPDQEVEISVDALAGAKLKGRVLGIAGATAATFSLLPQNNTTGNFIKVSQVVPVKISIENPANYVLVPGTSVEVKIATR